MSCPRTAANRDPDRDPAGRPRTAASRDRDPAGRPRNARPRDGLGRPLDRAAAGEPQLPGDLALTPDEAVRVAQQLIDAGRPFHAHEVLEEAWKAASGSHRELWRGLAQIAVGLTHARRGNDRGAVTLLRRGADAVGGHAGDVPGGLDPAAVRRAACDLADQIARDGLAGLTDDDLRIRLTS